MTAGQRRFCSRKIIKTHGLFFTKEALLLLVTVKREGAKLTMKWEGAGITMGSMEGNTFTMDNEGTEPRRTCAVNLNNS